MSKKRGQSTLEYVIILTAVVTAILVALTVSTGNGVWFGGAGGNGLGKLFKTAGDNIGARSVAIKGMVNTAP